LLADLLHPGGQSQRLVPVRPALFGIGL